MGLERMSRSHRCVEDRLTSTVPTRLGPSPQSHPLCRASRQATTTRRSVPSAPHREPCLDPIDLPVENTKERQGSTTTALGGTTPFPEDSSFPILGAMWMGRIFMPTSGTIPSFG